MRRALVASYAVLGVVGGVVSLVGDHPGRPFGIDSGLSVPVALAVGWGAALSAPWPLLVTFTYAGMTRRGPGWLVPAFAVVFMLGMLSEPIFWEGWRGDHRPAIVALSLLEVVVPFLVVVAWVRPLRRNDPVTAS